MLCISQTEGAAAGLPVFPIVQQMCGLPIRFLETDFEVSTTSGKKLLAAPRLVRFVGW